MNSPASPDKVAGAKVTQKRRYNSPLRRRQSADTRERIIVAGVELVHEFTTWDWTNLNARAVSERAGVSERTVYRHFTTEQNLRDAVMQALVAESGIDLESMTMENFAETTTLMFSYLTSFAAAPPEHQDPTLASMDQRRRDALLHAVARSLPERSEAEQVAVAATLDLFWNPSHYQRLVTAWHIEPEGASEMISRLIRLILEAIRASRRP